MKNLDAFDGNLEPKLVQLIGIAYFSACRVPYSAGGHGLVYEIANLRNKQSMRWAVH
jgi:hypothetical protein